MISAKNAEEKEIVFDQGSVGRERLEAKDWHLYTWEQATPYNCYSATCPAALQACTLVTNCILEVF